MPRRGRRAEPCRLTIDWEPVTTRFLGSAPVEIFEYQVISVGEFDTSE